VFGRDRAPHSPDAVRGRILARLRASLTPPDAVVTERPLPVRRFDWSPAQRRARFTEQLRAAQAEVLAVADDWPRALARRLGALGVKTLRYGSGASLASELCIGWPACETRLVRHHAPIECCRDALWDETDAAITSCVGAVAETGSLVLWPTPAEPRLLSLVPPVHVVLVEAAQLVSTLHELIVSSAWIERRTAGMPTNIVLISGPSKSADIEQTLAYGVHGPARLLVLIRG
jgi:L-lactate dehydrogenase complex protein LldG